MKKVTIVVSCIITSAKCRLETEDRSCHSQPITPAIARTKATGFPVARDVHFASGQKRKAIAGSHPFSCITQARKL